MQIREAKDSDLELLAPLQMEVQEFHRKVHPEIYEVMDVWGCIETLRRFIEDRSSWILIAYDARNILGYATLKIESVTASPIRKSDQVATVDQVVVGEAFRHKGVATHLMNEIKVRSKVHGCSQIRLDVLEFNTGALSFYDKLGFTTHRRRMVQKLDR